MKSEWLHILVRKRKSTHSCRFNIKKPSTNRRIAQAKVFPFQSRLQWIIKHTTLSSNRSSGFRGLFIFFKQPFPESILMYIIATSVCVTRPICFVSIQRFGSLIFRRIKAVFVRSASEKDSRVPRTTFSADVSMTPRAFHPRVPAAIPRSNPSTRKMVAYPYRPIEFSITSTPAGKRS